ncbi:unnamed protein product [Blepharisma stoltei]|uniref:DOMON domain-containing protein n=1 Tax=Blepharisma stoltei TaxID=1481888 RepID=A0AAU9JUE1_9CILI|nr:unnamed protein product [Blepharisma stoltei]
MTATISRLLSTGDSTCDKVLIPNMITGFSYAYLNQSNLQNFTMHSKKESGILGPTQGSSSFSIGGSELVTVDLDPKFSLTWIMTATEITFTFLCNFDGWCGIGFGESMLNTDMIIVMRVNGKFQAWDTWSTSFAAPEKDESVSGCKNDIELVSSIWNNGTMQVVMTRKLSTEDNKCDLELAPNMITGFCFGYLVQTDLSSFGEHNVVGSGTLKLGTSQSDSYFHGEASSLFGDPYENHGIEMTVIWLCTAQIGIMTMRYLKWWRLSVFFPFHCVYGLCVFYSRVCISDL